MLNQVQLIGRLGQDPKVNSTQSGTKVANISLATERKWKAGNETKSETTWHRIVFWDALAGVVEQYTRKGSLIFVQGRIAEKTYTKDGVEHRQTEIVASELKLLSTRDGGSGDGGGGGQQAAARSPAAQGGDPFSQDVPF